MNLVVKICGITSPAALEAAVNAGADAVGFVFYPTSPRHLEPAAAASLAQCLPAGVRAVAVTLHPQQTLVDSVVAAFTPDVWQTDAADFPGIGLPETIERWPVFRAGGGLPAALPPRLLYEGARSGVGERGDWAQARELARRVELILGGGLTVDNVAGAVRTVQPFGVDVSSGVESAPGLKDARRIRQFVAAAREAAAGVSG